MNLWVFPANKIKTLISLNALPGTQFLRLIAPTFLDSSLFLYLKTYLPVSLIGSTSSMYPEYIHICHLHDHCISGQHHLPPWLLQEPLTQLFYHAPFCCIPHQEILDTLSQCKLEQVSTLFITLWILPKQPIIKSRDLPELARSWMPFWTYISLLSLV